MRIIGGIYKNKKISLPTDKFTRPLKDMVRESIFNIIEHSNLIKKKILNSKVLDLYSGSGSFGVECLSRGASKVYFCEFIMFSNSELSDNYCTFTEESFNNASTFLTEQQKSQQKHIDKIMDRSFNTDSYFSDRNSTMSNIYSNQGFNPRKLHKNIVRQHEENKKRASQYQFNKLMYL